MATEVINITKIDHAVRVLKDLVENSAMPWRHRVCGDCKGSIDALVEGANKALERYKQVVEREAKETSFPDSHYWRGRLDGAERDVIGSAQAYAPKMAEAGMKVPA